MKKQSPKQTAKRNAKRPAPVGNGETAQGAAAGITAENIYQYNREQVRLFFSELPNDCALICDTVKNSLYDDGAGLLEDEELYKRLGRIAYIDNFIRYFGAYIEVEDTMRMMEDMATHDNSSKELKTVGVVDMKTLESLPTLDIDLLHDILKSGEDDKLCFRNVSLYYFSLWVNFHVGAVVSMFRKWVDVYGENVPPMLRDMSALARCVCVYTRTADNAHGGIFYDGGWFESFAMCGERRRKRNAAANETAQGGAADRKPDTGAADRDTAAARELLHGKPDTAQGTANPSGVAGVMNLYGDMIINTAKPIQVNAPAPAKQKPAGSARGFSQAKFAALLIHYGGKCHGAPYTARAVKIWDSEPDKRPSAGGRKYTPELRRDLMGARTWAKQFNEENENAYKARKARI